MRVYEFAKAHNLTSKEVLAALRDAGFVVANHMALVSPKEMEWLDSRFLKKEAPKEAAVEEVKPKNKEKNIVQSSVASVNEEINKQEKLVTPEVKKEQPALFDVELRPMTVGEFADQVGLPSSEVIVWLLKQGVVCNRNQIISETLLRGLAEHYQIRVIDSKKEQPCVEREIKKIVFEQGERRAPVVVVIGHVDHGKTTLLDFIRKTHVAAREKGGITQHLGAYEVESKHGKIVFLDTPGHEAFISMRQRGVKVADLAILVVAADDGVTPQTIEAISQAQAASVPIIVALNKIDKADARRIEQTMSALAKHGLVCEEWGGDTVCVQVSAKMGTNVDALVELVALQAELLELKTKSVGCGKGYILETKMEKGRGPVGTLILQQGTAKTGDYFIAGQTRGRINVIVDTRGEKLKNVGPTVPVQIAGFDSLAQAGDAFEVVAFTEYKKINPDMWVSSGIVSQVSASAHEEPGLKLVIKAGTNSSKEAVVASVQKLAQELNEKVVIVQAGVGNISGGDIDLAATFGGQVLGFGVKTESGAQFEAQRTGTPVKTFHVIYHLLDAIKEIFVRMKEPQYIEEKVGEAEVRKGFDIKNIGIIAGCYVQNGKIVQGGKFVVYRNKKKVGEGIIKTLQKDKKSFKEVAMGFECAFLAENFNDWQEGDRIECFVKKLVE